MARFSDEHREFMEQAVDGITPPPGETRQRILGRVKKFMTRIMNDVSGRGPPICGFFDMLARSVRDVKHELEGEQRRAEAVCRHAPLIRDTVRACAALFQWAKDQHIDEVLEEVQRRFWTNYDGTGEVAGYVWRTAWWCFKNMARRFLREKARRQKLEEREKAVQRLRAEAWFDATEGVNMNEEELEKEVWRKNLRECFGLSNLEAEILIEISFGERTKKEIATKLRICEGYLAHVLVSARGKVKPLLVDGLREKITTEQMNEALRRLYRMRNGD